MAAVEDEQPSTSSSTFSKEEVNKLMSQGKRHFVCEEIVEAVKCFEAACLMLNKQYGALSNECGDAHFHYGKSLFELARLESGVLGSALDEAVQEELADSDDDDGSMDAGSGSVGADSKSITTASKLIANEEMSVEQSAKNKMEEEGTESKIDDKTTEDNKEAEEKAAETSEEKPAKEENTEEKMVEDTPAGECKTEAKCSDVAEKSDIPQDKNKNNKESASQEQKEKDEAISENQDQNEKPEGQKDDKKIEDDKKNGAAEQNDEKDDEMLDDGPVSTIRLAWETLELARIVFKRHNSTEMQLKLAQTHLLLGEIHMEQEQFQDAVSELSKCLNIQKNLLKPDDRLLAETYYNLGLAYTLSMLYEESSNHYDNAAEVLELRVKNIKTRIEEAEEQDKGKGKAEDEDPVVKDRKELAELEELLPEIKAKSSDAKNESERLKSNIKMGLESMGVLGSSSSTCSTSCSDKPADDITHLVRKRRKSKNEEENTENVEGPAKKLRQEGESSTTQLENGDSKMEEAADTEAQS